MHVYKRKLKLGSLGLLGLLSLSVVLISLLSSSVMASSHRGHVTPGFSLGDPYPPIQYNTDKLYSVIGRSIAGLPLRKENYAPVALWSMGKVGYQTQVSMGNPIPYSVLNKSHINKDTVNNINFYTSKSRNLFVPVYQDQNLLGWVYVRVSGSSRSPSYHPSHIGYLNLARQWERVNSVWGPKGANPRLVLDQKNHVAYFNIPTLGEGNLTPVFGSSISKPTKTKTLFSPILKEQKLEQKLEHKLEYNSKKYQGYFK